MPLTPVQQSVMSRVVEEEWERVRRLQRAWAHYYGDAPRACKPTTDGEDDSVRMNLAATIVDKGASWLFGADHALQFAVEGDTTADDRLNEAWPVHRRALTLHQLAVNGGVTGHAFARLHEDARVTVLDPSNMDVKWHEDDVEHVLEFIHTWATVDRTTMKPVARRQRFVEQSPGALWMIVDEQSADEGDSWTEIDSTAWRHGFPPVFACQNLPAPNEYWGRADLEPDVLDLIEAIEGVASNMRRIVRLFGHPRPYVTGQQADEVRSVAAAVGRMLTFPNQDAKVGQLEMNGDLASSLALYQKLREALCDVARTPAVAFGATSLTNVAEETVELLFAPAVEKTWDKRLTYGPMLTDLTAAILDLAGGASGVTPAPQWPTVVPRSQKSESDQLESDQRMGIVSKQTLAELRGYDWEEEQQRMKDERSNAGADVLDALDRLDDGRDTGALEREGEDEPGGQG